MSNEEILSWERLFFEVKCPGCGKIAFTLPYRENTCHYLTCHKCKEISIFQVLSGGNIAFSTQKQKEKALEIFLDELEKYINSLSYEAIIMQIIDEYGNIPPKKYDYYKYTWNRMIDNKGFEGRISDFNNNSIFYVFVKTEGLLAFTKMMCSYSSNKLVEQGGLHDFSAFNNKLIVENININI